jgi:serine/threonine protein kinase
MDKDSDSITSNNSIINSFLSVFEGKYVIGEVLGNGAFGVVYKIRKSKSSKEYAVKVIF